MSTQQALENLISRPGESTGPLMSITCWCLVGVSAGFLLVRVSIRKSQGKLWLDDLILGVSWVSDKKFQSKQTKAH
jgi:hypothetical protein